MKEQIKVWKQALSIQPSFSAFQSTSEVAMKQTEKARKKKANDKAK